MSHLFFKEAKRYHSYLDEKYFYTWLEDIDCVDGVTYSSEGLKIEMNSDPTQGDLLDLIALFYRYDLNLKIFTQFLDEDNESWLRDPRAYWHEKMFS